MKVACAPAGNAPFRVRSKPPGRNRFGRWYLRLVEKLIQRHFERPRHFLQRLNRRDSVPSFHSRDITSTQSCTLFNIALREVLSLPNRPQSISDNQNAPTASATRIMTEITAIKNPIKHAPSRTGCVLIYKLGLMVGPYAELVYCLSS
jgi:hypothetical protein